VPLVVGHDPGPRTGLPQGRTYIELARGVYETVDPTNAQVKAVRRAAVRLVEAGRIERSRGGGEVEVRRLPTEADYELRAEVERHAQEWKEAKAKAEANATAYVVDASSYSGSVVVDVEPVLVIREDGVELREAQKQAVRLVIADRHGRRSA